MSKFIGREVSVGLAKEGTRGTAESTADFWIPKTTMSYDDGIEQVIDESSIAIIEDAQDAAVVGKFAMGELEGNIYDTSFGLILLGGFGSVSTSGPTETTVYTHTFTVGQSAQHQALSIFLNDDNQDYKYALGMIERLEMQFNLGEFAKYTASFRSKVGETATLTPSYSAENHFLPQHISLQYAADIDGLSSPTTVNVRSVRLNINKNIEDDRKLGSDDQADILNKQFQVDGEVELVFDAETFKTEMLANTQKAVRIALTNSDVTIGSSLNPKITIDMAKVKFGSFERNFSNDDIVIATIQFKALYSLSDTSMISAVLVNEQSTY